MIASLQSQVEEQAHSILELKNHTDKLEEKNIDLQLKVDKMLQQLFGRRSERRVDGDTAETVTIINQNQTVG